VVHRAATARPLLLVFDGFHEFDRASQELIAALAEELADAPLAIVVSHSSDLKWHWSDDIERFRLLPLSKEASTELVQSLFSEEVPASDLEQICAASSWPTPGSSTERRWSPRGWRTSWPRGRRACRRSTEACCNGPPSSTTR
jgi:hypothetical protein